MENIEFVIAEQDVPKMIVAENEQVGFIYLLWSGQPTRICIN